MKRWLIWVGVVLIVLVGVVLFEPTRVVLGYLKGESFFAGRPTSYWRNALKDPAPNINMNTLRALKEGRKAAVPMLIDLRAQDGPNAGDAETRWTAVEILGQIGLDAKAATPALLAALKDADSF